PTAAFAAEKSVVRPVAICRPVRLPDQQRFDPPLGGVAATISERHLRPPVVFIIGETAAHGPAWSWFEKRRLFGQTILITRPRDQADDLARPLAELGANVLFQPAIEIKPLQITDTSDRLI